MNKQHLTIRKQRTKKTPRVLQEYRSGNNDRPKLYNLNDFVLEIDKNFPLVYNLDSSSAKEDDNEPVKENDKDKSKFFKTNASLGSQIINKKKPILHKPWFMLNFYFIYLILCVIVMCCSFGFYYTIMSMRLKMEVLEKSLNNKFLKQVSMIISNEEIKKAEERLEEYLDYENHAKEKNLVFRPVVESYSFYSKESNFVNKNNQTLDKNSTSEFIDSYNPTQSFTSVQPTNLTTSFFENLIKDDSNFSTSTTTRIVKFSSSNLVDLIKTRHRKRLENKKRKSLIIAKKINQTCSIGSIYPSPISLIFMGVFHSNWMNNINSNDMNYYITKGFKGITISACQNLAQLKSYRCYRHISLKFSYYGTGHSVYKNYIFYHNEGTRNLIAHALDGNDVRTLPAPNDSLCCSQNDSIYSIKHSGFYDFEIDEHGLWLIYHDKSGYVVAKIDDRNFKDLKIVKKWHVRIQEKVVNMFIQCGQLYALKESLNSPAEIFKICDFLSHSECLDHYSQKFDIEISSRQITSLSYNPDFKILHSVDGGSLVYYKLKD